MQEFRFSNTFLDDKTEELKQFFEYIKAAYNAFPALIGSRLTLVETKPNKNEQGDVISYTVTGSASADKYGNFNGIDIPFNLDTKYDEIVNKAIADKDFDQSSIDSETKRDVYVEYVKLQNRINEIKSKGIDISIKDGNIVLSKDFEVVGEEGKQTTERTISI